MDLTRLADVAVQIPLSRLGKALEKKGVEGKNRENQDKDGGITLNSEVSEIVFVKNNYLGQALYILLSFLTVGMVPLLFIWSKKQWQSLRYSRVAQIEACSHLLLIGKSQQEEIVPLRVEVSEDHVKRTVLYKYLTYQWEGGQFRAVSYRLERITNNRLHRDYTGLNPKRRRLSREIYGRLR